MIRMLTTTYGESVISTPSWEIGRAERAHRERDDVHRAAAHRAGEQAASSSARISAGLAPVVGGAGVLLVLASR